MTTTPGARRWIIPVLRAGVAAIAALTITFSANHSAALGFIVLGAWAIATSAVLVLGAVRAELPRPAFLLLALVLLVGGTVSILLYQQSVAVLLFLVSTLFALVGVGELVVGILRRATAGARDWIFVGALSALLAVGALLIPADFSQAISIPGNEVPPLTASVIIVGLFGAYCAIVAVYLVIAGLSLKWATDPETASTEAR